MSILYLFKNIFIGSKYNSWNPIKIIKMDVKKPFIFKWWTLAKSAILSSDLFSKKITFTYEGK